VLASVSGSDGIFLTRHPLIKILLLLAEKPVRPVHRLPPCNQRRMQAPSQGVLLRMSRPQILSSSAMCFPLPSQLLLPPYLSSSGMYPILLVQSTVPIRRVVSVAKFDVPLCDQYALILSLLPHTCDWRLRTHSRPLIQSSPPPYQWPTYPCIYYFLESQQLSFTMSDTNPGQCTACLLSGPLHWRRSSITST
jgi:hypothetical protein